MCAKNVLTQSRDSQVTPAIDALVLVAARGTTVTLPDARHNAGLPITVKNTPAGSQTTLVAPAGQSIDGKSTYKLVPALAFARVETDGANYWVVAAG